MTLVPSTLRITDPDRKLLKELLMRRGWWQESDMVAQVNKLVGSKHNAPWLVGIPLEEIRLAVTRIQEQNRVGEIAAEFLPRRRPSSNMGMRGWL